VSGRGSAGSDAELAAALVRDAGELAARMLRDGLTTQHKTSISDVVSAADHAAEELIAGRLHAERPDDGVVGEEGADRPGARTWFVDPVDGTYNFLSGIPVWCAAVALTDADGLVLGAVYQPSTDELWVGGRDHPTTLNGARVEPLTDRPLAELSLASYLHPTTLPDDRARIPLLRAMEGAATVRMLGSGSVEMASIASGRVGASLQLDSKDWDWLPGRALVGAAGGASAVITANGHRWHVASNRQAVDEIVARVRGDEGLGGVEGRLTALLADGSARIGCAPRLTVKGSLESLPEPVVAALEEVLGEAVANTVTHAYASSVSAIVTLAKGVVTLTVRDNGVGPLDEPAPGRGLARMAELAEKFDGSFVIEPDRPMGTRIVWSAAYRRGASSKSR
jgi:fructose-1,6-bisphosphatase/inositol monophosphatase family enzyme/anti-sigma regulatory factor (Ser/Thr protein kinase)